MWQGLLCTTLGKMNNSSIIGCTVGHKACCHGVMSYSNDLSKWHPRSDLHDWKAWIWPAHKVHLAQSGGEQGARLSSFAIIPEPPRVNYDAIANLAR